MVCVFNLSIHVQETMLVMLIISRQAGLHIPHYEGHVFVACSVSHTAHVVQEFFVLGAL